MWDPGLHVGLPGWAPGENPGKLMPLPHRGKGRATETKGREEKARGKGGEIALAQECGCRKDSPRPPVFAKGAYLKKESGFGRQNGEKCGTWKECTAGKRGGKARDLRGFEGY